MEEFRSLTIGALLQRGFHQSVGTTGRGHHFATDVKMKRASADFVDVCMDVHRLLDTSNKCALCSVGFPPCCLPVSSLLFLFARHCPIALLLSSSLFRGGGCKLSWTGFCPSSSFFWRWWLTGRGQTPLSLIVYHCGFSVGHTVMILIPPA